LRNSRISRNSPIIITSAFAIIPSMFQKVTVMVSIANFTHRKLEAKFLVALSKHV
jgi:hypothetical protein